MLNNPDYLLNKIKSLPDKPGVYMMKDSQGKIIYIGKSKCLNKRVKSYFNRDHKWEKLKRLVFNIDGLEYIVTDTHLEAQLLECQLIKRHKPIYNSQFAKDRNYVYLRIEECNTISPLSVSLEKEGRYIFGPFRSRRYIYNLTNLMAKLYPIRKDEDGYQFEYNPLPYSMSERDFEENKKCLIEILSTRNHLEAFLNSLKRKMEEASSGLLFERASHYRDTLLSAEYIYRSLENDITKDKRILMGEKIDQGFKLFYIYDGNLIMKKSFFNLSLYDVEDFILQAENMSNHNYSKRDEKSNMDYKIIINKELKDMTSKVVEEINIDFNAKLFWDKLTIL